jgi:hypothetical protein
LPIATDREAVSGYVPSSPEKLSLADWLAAFKRSFASFRKDDCAGLAQQGLQLAARLLPGDGLSRRRLWLNYSAFARLFGAELNAELERQAEISAAGGERAGP